MFIKKISDILNFVYKRSYHNDDKYILYVDHSVIIGNEKNSTGAAVELGLGYM